MSKRKPKGYWTLERCKENAAQFESRNEWEKGCRGAYKSAHRNGWLDHCCNHMTPLRKPKGHWTLERCMSIASKYSSRKQWAARSHKSYDAAVRNGWTEKCSAHMDTEKRQNGYWTLERCRQDASRFSTKAEWRMAGGSGHDVAHKHGWIEECCAHMEPGYTSTANDVVYLWRDSDTDLHKIGVTSDRIGEHRIVRCKNNNDMDPRIVFMLKVADARAVESQLLELGTDPELDSSIDGYTEFRVLSNDDLREAVSIAYEAALAA